VTQEEYWHVGRRIQQPPHMRRWAGHHQLRRWQPWEKSGGRDGNMVAQRLSVPGTTVPIWSNVMSKLQYYRGRIFPPWQAIGPVWTLQPSSEYDPVKGNNARPWWGSLYEE
jgi:hypothetical protein